MPTLAARLAVSAAGAVVVMAGVEAVRLRHPRAIAKPPAPEELMEQVMDPSPQSAPSLAVTARWTPRRGKALSGTRELARIHGRVLGDRDALEALEVKLEDSEGQYEAMLTRPGEFEITLPAGDYVIQAFADEQIALASVRDLRAGELRGVVMMLSEGVSIEGQMLGCEGPCEDATVEAKPVGTHSQACGVHGNAKGEFVVDGLVPGQAYRLEFRAVGMRPLVFDRIMAPTRGLVASLQPSASLVGGFGVAPGEACPMKRVQAQTSDDDWEAEANFDDDCRFHIENLPAAASLRLRANGVGWYFDLEVPLPAKGDPPFLCLRPTCREPEPKVQASLAVRMTGGAQGSIRVHVSSSDGEILETICSSPESPCVLDGLRPGPKVSVSVTAQGCDRREYHLDLHAGENDLQSPCDPMREIQGMIRVEGELNATVRLRCDPRHPDQPSHGYLFVLHCPARLTTIEYQIGDDGPWRTAEVLSHDGAGIGRVDIVVD